MAEIRLVDRMRRVLRAKRYGERTEQAHCLWVRRYIMFHDGTYPSELDVADVNAYLTYLAVEEKVPASTQTQALSAILFLYRHVLFQPLGALVW